MSSVRSRSHGRASTSPRLHAIPTTPPRWYVNIKSVVWQTPRPMAVGSRLEFDAQFLGRRLAYTYEVAEHVPGERFVMDRTGAVPDEDDLGITRACAGASTPAARCIT